MKRLQVKQLDGGIPIKRNYRPGQLLRLTLSRVLEEKKLTQQARIPIFTQGQDPEEHIKTCEKEWRRLGYKDERAWPHFFPSTLAELSNKWYKMEEDRGETFLWHELRENFIKDFNFIPQNKNLVETTKQIKQFIQPIEKQPSQDHQQIKDCNNLQIWSKS